MATEEPPLIDSDPASQPGAVATALLWLRRTLAIFGILATSWMFIGSIWFPAWWNVAIWSGQLTKAAFLSAAFAYLVEDRFWLVILVPAAVVSVTLLSIFLAKYCRRLIDAVDRFAIRIIIICGMVCFCVALVLAKTQEQPAPFVLWMWGAEIPSGDLPTIEPLPNEIEPPVDFHYIDDQRVSAIFSEVESDLIETKRTISNGTKAGVAGGVNAPVASLKADASKSAEQTTEFQKPEASVYRKCIELMNFGLKNGKTHYFTNIQQYYEERGISMRVDGTDNLTKLKLELADKELPADATGLVIVDGSFHVIRANGVVHFEEEFSPRPRHIVFRFSLPERSDPELFKDGRRLRVFGDVIDQLNSKSGVIEIHPLAVF